ncbi:calcium-binding protein [Rhizobium sp. TRM95796]|uniref:calcium-binding protein n=1 Tax=Rhizobium sp. TRM95796 TaxID=2979862 RepID=UPI0021E7442E|nr:hypothetical protein [Rhizobium sp. TRM95796]MCV3764526.1 hypothetical protein [Rhizobium sp. TRM95796]
MSTFHVSSNRNTTLIIDGGGDRFIVDQGVTIRDPDMAIHLTGTATNNRVEIRGVLRCEEDTIFDQGTGSIILVTGTGKLIGDDGIYSVHGGEITNRGLISMFGDGIGYYDQGHFTNAGTLKAGSDAVTIAGGRVDNLGGATIRSNEDGINSLSDEFDVLRINNEGLLIGKTTAIKGFNGREIVVNSGDIQGKIDLGGSNDSFDTRKGTVDQDVIGGAGNDTLWTSNGTIRLVEAFGGGTDIVRSTVSYTLAADVEMLVLLGAGNTTGKGNASGNGLTGNSANNKLFGQDNNDFLDGRAGNDMLSGGSAIGDEDTFYFKTGYGGDTIIDFQDDTDKLALKELNGVTGFADLKAHHVMENSAGDLVIFSGQDRLIVEGMTIATLTSNDVYFD